MAIVLQNVSAIIFDLGAVIININPSLAHKAFENLGVSQIDKQFTISHQEGVFKDFEIGKITVAEFRDSFRQFITTPVSDAEIDAAWNAMILDIPPHRIELLKELNNKYNTYLLSNTNAIHTQFIFDYLQKTYGLKNLNPLFNKCYYSQDIGMRKPNAEAFEYVLNTHNLNPTKTLFLDDNADNINAAKALGIQAVLVKEDIANYFA